MKTSTLALIACSTAATLVAVFAIALPRWYAYAQQQAAEAEMTALVDALAHPSPAVADAAAKDLRQVIDEWQSLPPEVVSLPVARLANDLAQRAPAIPVRQHHAARGMAQRLLLWPLDSDADAGNVIADCETILRICKPLAPQEVVPRTTIAAPQYEEVVAVPSTQPPQASVPIAANPEGEERAPAFIATQTDPSPWPAPKERGNAPPQRFFEPPPVAAVEPKRFLAPRAARSAIAEVPPAAAIAPANETPDAAPERFAYLQDLADVEVMRHLHGSDPERIAAAKTELASRGFQAQHLPLATALTHPDAARRRRLAESLPLLRGIDPRPWLLQLQADPDPEVRHAAESILQTSRDPATTAR